MPMSAPELAAYRAGLERGIEVLRAELRDLGRQQTDEDEAAQVAELEKQSQAQRRAAEASAKRIVEEVAAVARETQAEGKLSMSKDDILDTPVGRRMLAEARLARVTNELERDPRLESLPDDGGPTTFARVDTPETNREQRKRERFLSWSSANGYTDLDQAETRYRELYPSGLFI